jgi:hypothetical protein
MCEGFGIADERRAFFKSEINKIMLGIAEWITDDLSTPSRNADLDRLKSIDSELRDTIEKVNKMGPKGSLALRAISDFIAPMLSAGWINHQFPGDDWAPTKSIINEAFLADGARPPMHEPARGRAYFIEEQSLEARYQFVRNRSKNTLLATLTQTQQGIEAALSMIKSDPAARGGRPSLQYRRYMLANLATLWRSIGKRTPTSPSSEFVGFCEYVFECAGWPKRGVASDIPRALQLLAERSG